MKSELARAMELRSQEKPQEAMVLLQELLQSNPANPDILYQIAWTFDSMGKESEAAPYYEKAIESGLVEDRAGAILGLGSTYRCLGEYQKSLKMLDQGVAEFPEDRAMKVFRALTLFNLGKFDDSVGELLIQLLDTTNDNGIKSYDRALRFYSDKLSETWVE